MELKFAVPCLFGLEGLAADELRRMDMANVAAENGRVLFTGTERDIPRANIRLATGERLLILLGEFGARSFDELFEGTKALPWERFIPAEGAFPVKGHCLNSALHSVPDCQKIVKKAAVERLRQSYKTDWFKEEGEKYQIQFAIMKDRASLYLDTSGAGLHKRGYRPVQSAAPLRETLAAAIVRLSRYRGKESFLDPFCGSGTIAIEAALAALNRAPGLERDFSAESWRFLPKKLWYEAADEARGCEFTGEYQIEGSDIDEKCVELSRENAERAGVGDIVRFRRADALTLPPQSGIVAANPPYGERLLDKASAEALYRALGRAELAQGTAKKYFLSANPDFETFYGAKAAKKRKLYNGMLKCDLFMYM